MRVKRQTCISSFLVLFSQLCNTQETHGPGFIVANPHINSLADSAAMSSCDSDITNVKWCDRDVELVASVHSDQIGEVHNVPMRVIIRPIPSILDEDKVKSLMETIKVMTHTY